MNDAAQSDQLWQEVCAALRYHFMTGHGCIDTINRLWRKDPFVAQPQSLPVIQRRGILVTKEQWGLKRLWPFIHEKRITDLAPGELQRPLIILRFAGVDHLRDGRRRINHWQRVSDQGPHEVLIVDARQGAS